MNRPNFQERARGWIPENPKTSKRKLKLMYTSVVLSTTILISVFSSAFIVQLIVPSTLVLPPYVHTSTSNPPFSTFIEFQGIPTSSEGTYWIENGVRKEIEPTFSITWNNGSNTNSKVLNMSFSTNAESYYDDNFQVHLALVADNFFAEKTLDGTMVNGKLIVNSNPSIFMIKPDLLVPGTQIYMGETSDWRLIGDVSNSTWKLSTAIEEFRVETMGVHMYHSTTNVPKNWLTLNLGYDINTGMLVSAQGVLSDVLLDAVGIKWIMSSDFKLISYSENLNLEVMEKKPLEVPDVFPFWILIILPVIVGIIAILAYHAHKRKSELSLAWKGLIDTQDNSNLSKHRKGN